MEPDLKYKIHPKHYLLHLTNMIVTLCLCVLVESAVMTSLVVKKPGKVNVLWVNDGSVTLTNRWTNNLSDLLKAKKFDTGVGEDGLLYVRIGR